MKDIANLGFPHPDRLRALLDYNPDTGLLRWKKKTPETEPRDKERLIFNINWGGKPAFTSVDKHSGYVQGKVSGKKMWGHRVAWAIHYGYWPDACVTHSNGKKSDNRICNLKIRA